MAKVDFIAAGANRQPFASDWSASNGLVAYGSSRMIALWNPISSKVLALIKGHTNTVTAIRFVNNDIMVSGSADASLKVWSIHTSGTNRNQYDVKCLHTISDVHNKSITSLAVSDDIVISGSADGLVAIWKLEEISNSFELKLIEKKSIGPRFYPLSLAVHKLLSSPSSVVVAVGGTSNDIYIFSCTLSDSPSLNLDAKLAGHENWIRSLAFKKLEDSKDILLASASQDNYIRLWRIHEGDVTTIGRRTADIPDEEGAAGVIGDEEGELSFGNVASKLLSNKVYHINDSKYILTFEALLMGHDDWIYAVNWHPHKLQLLSASSDSTLMLWSPDESSGIWICSTRLGDVSIKGASTATGSSGGFWNALWLENGNSVATVGRTGSWRIWGYVEQQGEWVSQVGISGHVREVTDLSWEDEGKYLLSTSLDQTTRLFSTWKLTGSWHEISRPQIHGYDMITVKSLSSEVFVSAGDEKTLRVFEQPKGIAILLENVCGIITTNAQKENLPESATVPVLGLSNKQEELKEKREEEDNNDENDEVDADVDDVDDDKNNIASNRNKIINKNYNNDEDNANDSTTTNIRSTLIALREPPKEDHLQRQTLWPELEKLYGHGYEISAIDVNKDKTILATCCKANNETHAVIRLYDTKKWLQIQPTLALHNLTITRLRFSPDNKYLLSVSRDRQWGLWSKTDGVSGSSYQLAASNPKGHIRIIWDCSWLPDSTGFVTASRDKSIKLWKKVVNNDDKSEEWKEVNQLKFDAAVTAIDVDPQGRLIAGLETGALYIYQIRDESSGAPFSLIEQIDDIVTPAQRVSRVTWRPHSNQVAVASEDFAVRIYSI